MKQGSRRQVMSDHPETSAHGAQRASNAVLDVVRIKLTIDICNEERNWAIKWVVHGTQPQRMLHLSGSGTRNPAVSAPDFQLMADKLRSLFEEHCEPF